MLQAKYLCKDLRPIIDAGFQGDLHAMRYIISQQLAAAGPAAAPPAGANGAGPATPTRGIVVAAGSPQYIANAFVNLYVLQRHLNCTVPVVVM